jgi:RHS repeat-associated protein
MERPRLSPRRINPWAISVAGLLIGLGVASSPSLAQFAPPPVRSVVDANGVDLVSGRMVQSSEEVAIGNAGSGGLIYERTLTDGGWRDNLSAVINNSGSVYTVSFGGASETFTLSSGTFTPGEGQGSSLTYNSTTQLYTYTRGDGTVVLFDHSLNFSVAGQPQANQGRIINITTPNGEVDTFTYNTASYCIHYDTQWQQCDQDSDPVVRLQAVTNNLGYQIHLEYAQDSVSTEDSTLGDWLVVSKVTGINGAIDYCDPTANSCTGLSRTWPSATYGVASDNALAQTVTDTMGRVTRYTFNSSGQLTGIRRPAATSDSTVITYDGVRVASVSNGVGTWNYALSGGEEDPTFTVTVTDPLSHTRAVFIDGATGLVHSDTNGAGKTTSYDYDTSNRLIRITYPEGNKTEYAYDGRGNVTTVTQKAKTGSGLTDIVTSASYDSTCSNPKKCNKPNSVTDALGKVTDYTYDSTTGALATVTLPAPTTGAVRPQTRYTYSSLSAYYKNGAGSIVAAPSSVSMLTGISECLTGSTSSPTCVGTSDEVKTAVVYGTTGVANNLLPTSMSKGAGDSSLTATTAYTYDAIGNRLTVDGPLSGTTDTTRYRYDEDRELVGMVGPDPDGAGSLKNRATRFTYNNDGQVTQVEQGTVNSQSDSDWSGFTLLEKQNVTYDSRGLRSKATASNAAGTTLAAVQFTYDNASRLDCTAVRMNPSVFGSLPSSACSLGTTGSNGPDRITKNVYDGADRLSKVTEGYASGTTRDEVTITYTNNGLRATVADALGGLTTYEYDGFDRLLKTRYPIAGTRTSSSTTDYEGYTYDAGSRVTADRRRDGSSFGLTYDNLGRVTLLDAPTGQNDITYAYNNLGRPTSLSYSGHTQTFGYDALGRTTSAGGPLGTVSYQYDLADRRTRMTWPDSFYITYDYNADGDVTAIRENGASSGVGVLATYTYDNLDRRASLTRGNGVTTTYSFDDLSQLTSLAQDLAGTSDDQTYSMTLNTAGDVLTRSGSNSAYAASAPFNGTKAYTANGLNQITVLGAHSLSYDGRGNLTSDGANTYAYDGLNRLTDVNSGTASLAYDPIGRLYQASTSSTSTRFEYDGLDLVTEYNNSGTVQRRYVHGPADDEPLVWYEGSGTSDRRWLITDDQGSIVATTNSSGSRLSTNKYDEYGVPDSANTGRFQYTGQTWLPEAGLYYYKARFYSAPLGRFLQPDPIGYGDGLNIYDYAGTNPVSAFDPTGTRAVSGIPAVEGLRPGDDFSPVDALGRPRFMIGQIGFDADTEVDPVIVIGRRHHESACNAECVAQDMENWRDQILLNRLYPTRVDMPEGDWFDDHKNNARPSTKGRHQKGISRKQTDRGGEKADKKSRRPPRIKPKGWKGPWPPFSPGFFLFIIPGTVDPCNAAMSDDQLKACMQEYHGEA